MGDVGGPAAGARWSGSGRRVPPPHLPTVAGLLGHARTAHPEHLAVATPEGQLTYRELDERSAALAAQLVSNGVGKGSRVGILLPNGIAWVIAWAAVTRIGAVATPVNTFYRTPEMAAMLRHADVQVLVAVSSLAPHDYVERLLEIAPGLAEGDSSRPLFLPELPQLRSVLFWDDAPVSWARSGVGATLRDASDEHLARIVAAIEADVVPADPMLITYTSGSTGEPKGVVHGHGPLLRHARTLADMSGIDPTDRIWTPMPLCWVGGFAFTLLRALSVGAAFVTQERMDAGIALDLLERYRVSCVSAWPSIGTTLCAHPGFDGTDLSALRLGTFYEGRAVADRPADPTLCVTSLGMSETAGPHTFWTMEDDLRGVPEEHRGAFGHQVPGFAHRILDADGRDVPEGTEGEVLVRGDAMMLGLHKRERAEVFDEDGWYHTGDRGSFRDGWFFFGGRRDDLIKTKGANVAPIEVEAALTALEGVTAAFVFGVEHAERGQDVVALVVGENVTEARLRAGLREALSSYKVPRHVFALAAEQVPYLTSQKADRRRLAALAAELTDAARRA